MRRKQSDRSAASGSDRLARWPNPLGHIGTGQSSHSGLAPAGVTYYPDLRTADFFFLRLPNGLGTALLGTVSTFLTASRNRVNASGPSIISRVAGFTITMVAWGPMSSQAKDKKFFVCKHLRTRKRLEKDKAHAQNGTYLAYFRDWLLLSSALIIPDSCVDTITCVTAAL